MERTRTAYPNLSPSVQVVALLHQFEERFVQENHRPDSQQQLSIVNGHIAKLSCNQFPPLCPNCGHQFLYRKWRKFNPICVNCGHELKRQCDYCHDEYTPKSWTWDKQQGRWRNRFCSPKCHRDWHNNGHESIDWKQERTCACGCEEPFMPKFKRHIFKDDFHQYRHYRALHAEELDARAVEYYKAHKEEIAAQVRRRRQADPERYHAQQKAWRGRNKDKVKEMNARSRAAALAKQAEAEQAVVAAKADVDRLTKELAQAKASLSTAKKLARRKSYTPDQITSAIDLVRKVPHVANRVGMQALDLSRAEFFRWIRNGKLKSYRKGFVYSAPIVSILDRGVALQKK